jgi:hypothetical protein
MRALKFCVIALAAGLLPGVVIGSHVGRTWVAGQAILWEASAAGGYEELANLQYGQADTDHARQALLGFTNFSKSLSRLPSAQHHNALLLDTGRTYLQLAAIEELAGNRSLSHQYVLSAQESFKGTGHDIPEEKLDQEVTKIIASSHPNGPPS